MLDALDKITLGAFLIALSELNTLPTPLQQKINDVGQKYAQQGDTAISDLEKLAENNLIKALYEQARRNIQEKYETKELSRYYDPDNQVQPTVTHPDAIDNIVVTIPLEPLEILAIKILISADSCIEAKRYKREIENLLD